MKRQFIRSQDELDKFCVAVCEDESVDVIAADAETEAFSDDGKWSPESLRLDGVGIYATKKYQAFIVAEYIKDWSIVDVMFHSKPVVFHNAKFDVPVFEHHKVISHVDEIVIHDTMLMSYIEDENKLRHGLKELARTILKVPPEKITEFKDIVEKPKVVEGTLFSNTQEEADSIAADTTKWENTLGEYCINDCEYTYKLFQKFSKELKETDGLWRVYEEIELPFMRVLMGMEKRGVRIDTKYLKDLERNVEEKLIDLGVQIYKEAGQEFTIDSPMQLTKILTQMGYELPDEFRTSKGAISVNKAALAYLRDEKQCSLAGLVLQYRELGKLQSTYIQAIPRLATDEIIRCRWNQIGTVTGRISSSDPNLQQIPRRDDEFNIRRAFRPREGYSFIIADYSQIELRIMAYFSQDPKLIQTYQEGGDIHDMVAKRLNVSRHVAKTISFGINYGRTAFGLMKSLDMTQEECQQVLDSYLAEFPGVKKFMDKAINTVRKKKFVQTITKRRRRFDNYNSMPLKAGQVYGDLSEQEQYETNRERKRLNSSMERQGANAVIQGSAADLIKIAMINLSKKLKQHDAHILLQIHDEVVVECPKGKEDIISKIMKAEMEGAVKLPGVPLLIEPKVSDVWSK